MLGVKLNDYVYLTRDWKSGPTETNVAITIDVCVYMKICLDNIRQSYTYQIQYIFILTSTPEIALRHSLKWRHSK